jgi:hypothetical protein
MATTLLRRMAGEPPAGLTHLLHPDFDRLHHS